MDNREDLIQTGTFSINDDNAANWAVKIIKEEMSERDRLINIANSEILELQEKIKRLTNQYENKIAYLKTCLHNYFDRVDTKETKTQRSYKLLNGSLILKKSKQKIVKDDDKLVEYLLREKLDEFVKIQKSPDWSNFKKYIKIVNNVVIDIETGEIIDALRVEDVPESFDIKF